MTVILNERHAVVEPAPMAREDGRPCLVYRVDNRVGEAPLWDAARGCLWWIDVRAPELLRLDPGPSVVTRWTLPEPVGALAMCGDGTVLLALRHQAWRFDPASCALAPFAEVEPERPLNRLNEGKVSTSGRWWLVGSMDDRPEGKQPLGALYRIDAAGGVERLHDGLVVANGVAWSLDGSRIFFSDSARGQILSAPWDEAAGRMGRPEPFARADEAAGRPDGALVDAQGHYLSAGVSAGRLNRFDPAGRCIETVALPCRAPTMPCFGGARGQDLYVTSLVRPHWPADEGGLDGQLYCLPAFTYISTDSTTGSPWPPASPSTLLPTFGCASRSVTTSSRASGPWAPT